MLDHKGLPKDDYFPFSALQVCELWRLRSHKLVGIKDSILATAKSVKGLENHL